MEKQECYTALIDIEECLPHNPHHFQTKFFKQLNTFQNYRKKQKRKKNKEQIYATYETIKKIQTIVQKQPQNLIQEEVFRNGNRIKGTWKNNQLHGDVSIQYHDSAYFQGIFENGVRIYGKFIFADGHQYQGGFLCDQFNGQGVLKYPTGKTIEGQWNQGVIEGNATITYPKGDVYYGQVENYKKHGQGYLFFSNGSKYIGQFKQGQITGVGSYYQNDILISHGLWQKGELVEIMSGAQLNDDDD